MHGFNTRNPLIVEIMMAIVMLSISMLVVIGTTLKALGSIIHTIVHIICCIVGLFERIRHERTISAKYRAKV